MRSRKDMIHQASPNLALIKYWGKMDHRLNLPMNASLSVPLGDFWTRVSIWKSHEDGWKGDLSRFTLDAKERILTFFALVRSQYPELPPVAGTCQSNFPPGCGIASSAAFYAALSAAVLDVINIREPSVIARVARLGSGSATRSVHPNGWTAWLPGGTYDSVGYILEDCVLPVNWYDYALVFDIKHKKIPSREGHRMMDESPIRDSRIKNANRRFLEACHAIQKTDWETLCKIVHEETLEFTGMLQGHSQMRDYHNAQSQEALSKLNTLFTTQPHLKPWTYTIDAGSTVHVLGEEAVVENVISLLKSKPVETLTSRIYGGLLRVRSLTEPDMVLY